MAKNKLQQSIVRLVRKSDLTTVTAGASSTGYGAVAINISKFPNWANLWEDWEYFKVNNIKVVAVPTKLGNANGVVTGLYAITFQDADEGSPNSLATVLVRDGSVFANLDQGRTITHKPDPRELGMGMFQDCAASVVLDKEVTYALENMISNSSTQLRLFIEFDITLKGFRTDL